MQAEFAGIGRAVQSAMKTQPAYKNLDTWQQAMNLVETIYQATAKFPSSELYGLTSQLRRAAVSIPANIAEGYCRRNTRVYANHVSIALGSHGEVETLIELASRLGFLNPKVREAFDTRTDSVGKLLSGLFRSIEERSVDRKKDTPSN
jgi:four helix bundle protein